MTLISIIVLFFLKEELDEERLVTKDLLEPMQQDSPAPYQDKKKISDE